MATKTKNEKPLISPYALTVIVFSLLVIAVSTLAGTALALKNSDQGKSDVAHQQCLNGIQTAGIETGNCTLDELQRFGNILYIRETQGVKAAKDACFSQMTSQGCRGICVGAIHCYDLQ